MKDFNIGDTVTLNGRVVTELTSGVGLYVSFDGGASSHFISCNALKTSVRDTGTDFRDQAAIAALQGMLINTAVSPGGDARAMAKSSFELAEALDAERKKRNGGE